MFAILLVATLSPGLAEPPAAVGKSRILGSTRAWQLFAASGPDRALAVITAPAELAVAMGKPVGQQADALTLAARAFKVKEVDLGKQMILVIAAGVQRSGGYSVEVTDLVRTPEGVTVKWKLNAPPPGAFVTAALTRPGVAVLIDRVPGKVTFDPPLPGRK